MTGKIPNILISCSLSYRYESLCMQPAAHGRRVCVCVWECENVLTVWNPPRSSDWVGVIFSARRLLAAVLLEGRAGEWRLAPALLGWGRTREKKKEKKKKRKGCKPVLGVTGIETTHQTLLVVVKWKVTILILRLVFESIVHDWRTLYLRDTGL